MSQQEPLPLALQMGQNLTTEDKANITAALAPMLLRAELGVDEDYQLCPRHGDTLQHAADQGHEHEQREHLECYVCGYEVWA